jgi:hypothetical protein
MHYTYNLVWRIKSSDNYKIKNDYGIYIINYWKDADKKSITDSTTFCSVVYW